MARPHVASGMVLAFALGATGASAQMQPPPGPGAPPPGPGPGPGGPPPPGYGPPGAPPPAYGAPPPQGPPAYAPGRPAASRKSSLFEIGTLYATSVGYGVGLGIWIDSEVGLTDPGVALIPPAVLGLAAPIGVYFLDQPAMPRGKPSAIAAGLAIGAAEGLGIASTQFVTAREENAWGFRGLGRSVAIGATLGGVGGWALGEFAEPSPKSTAFVASGGFWGTTIGSAFGYGISPEGAGFGGSNDSAALGGLIGLNAGLAAAAGLSFAFVPTWSQITGMWIGSGVGAAVSLPVFLFYAGESTPPAKRGLVFTGTAMLLGIGAGALFAPRGEDADATLSPSPSGHASTPSAVQITHVAPVPLDGGGQVVLGGLW